MFIEFKARFVFIGSNMHIWNFKSPSVIWKLTVRSLYCCSTTPSLILLFTRTLTNHGQVFVPWANLITDAISSPSQSWGWHNHVQKLRDIFTRWHGAITQKTAIFKSSPPREPENSHSSTWFSEGLWQWMPHYEIILGNVHCFRCIWHKRRFGN
jgi:hypothetical protein